MRHKIAAYLLTLVITSLLIASCQNRPKEVLNRKKMERLMYDVYIAEATIENDYQNFNTPEKKEAYINEVFKEHNVTQARWDSSLSWYSDRIDLYLKMNDSVKARLKRSQESIAALLAQESAIPFSYDPSVYSDSYIPPYYSFGAIGADGGFRFSLDSANIASDIPENYFLFRFDVIGIPPESNYIPTALLALVYRDTTLYHHRKIKENRHYRIAGSKYIESDTLSHIYGYIHLQQSITSPSQIQLYNIFLGNEHLDDLGALSDTISIGSVLEDSLRSLDVEAAADIAPEPLRPDSGLERSDVEVGVEDSIKTHF